jgi:hypothetical protein
MMVRPSKLAASSLSSRSTSSMYPISPLYSEFSQDRTHDAADGRFFAEDFDPGPLMLPEVAAVRTDDETRQEESISPWNDLGDFGETIG